MDDIQLAADGSLRHLLSTEGLDRAMLNTILDTAERFVGVNDRDVRKVPLLRGKTVANLFFETSTRTRSTFELAAKRLSADVLNINIATSSTATKGESLLDTLHTLQAMYCDMFVVRHAESGAAHFIARNIAPHVGVVNAGDGQHAHPTQALLDMLTIRRLKGRFEPLRVAIVGDLLHSRVFRSQLHALHTLNTGEVRVVAPRTLLPACVEQLGVQVHTRLDRGLQDVDVVMMMRLQRERMQGAFLPSEGEYFAEYGLTPERLRHAHPDAIVMHPGPTNRGVEIAASVADGAQSVILQQVACGIAVRMAVMAMVAGSRSDAE